jgi:hypothetical protein
MAIAVNSPLARATIASLGLIGEFRIDTASGGD